VPLWKPTGETLLAASLSLSTFPSDNPCRASKVSERNWAAEDAHLDLAQVLTRHLLQTEDSGDASSFDLVQVGSRDAHCKSKLKSKRSQSSEESAYLLGASR
jgi:hypothetical protein